MRNAGIGEGRVGNESGEWLVVFTTPHSPLSTVEAELFRLLGRRLGHANRRSADAAANSRRSADDRSAVDRSAVSRSAADDHAGRAAAATGRYRSAAAAGIHGHRAAAAVAAVAAVGVLVEQAAA